jgi:hypothetical protein
VCFLAAVELGLLAPQSTFRLGDLHALAGTEPDQVRLKLRHHRQHVEQQPSDGIGGVVDRPAQGEADLPGSELIGDRPQIRERAGEAVELGHYQGVASPARGQGFAQSGSFPVGPGQAVVDVDPSRLDAEAEQGVALRGHVLLISGASGVPDKQWANSGGRRNDGRFGVEQ